MLEPEIMRHRIARIIAATRFPFVDQDTWPSGQQTIINDEIKRYAISTDLGVLYPNIVIANPDGTIREIGVVESREDISEDSVPRWKALSKAAPIGREFKKLFLYVPDGTEEKTKKLIEEYGINYDGIRSYSVTKQTLKIIPYVTRNDEYDHTIT
jgi:hypothetical protein